MSEDNPYHEGNADDTENAEGGQQENQEELSKADETILMLEIRDLLNRLYELMESLRRKRKGLQIQPTPIFTPEYNMYGTYSKYWPELSLLDLLGTLKSRCVSWNNPLDVHELVNCIEGIKDVNEKLLVFETALATMLRYPYVAPILMPYDPRCKPKSFSVVDAPASTTDEDVDGLTWTVVAECPSPNGSTEEKVFTGQVLYSSLTLYSPAQREADVGTQNSFYFNVIFFGPIMAYMMHEQDKE